MHHSLKIFLNLNHIFEFNDLRDFIKMHRVRPQKIITSFKYYFIHNIIVNIKHLAIIIIIIKFIILIYFNFLFNKISGVAIQITRNIIIIFVEIHMHLTKKTK